MWPRGPFANRGSRAMGRIARRPGPGYTFAFRSGQPGGLLHQNNDRTDEAFKMYAVIVTGGRQFRVMQGDVLRVEKLDAEVDAAVKFEQVLMIGDGENITVGAPNVAGASVAAKVRGHGRHDKVRIVKFRRRKHHRKQMGHRQHYTEIEITGISR